LTVQRLNLLPIDDLLRDRPCEHSEAAMSNFAQHRTEGHPEKEKPEALIYEEITCHACSDDERPWKKQLGAMGENAPRGRRLSVESHERFDVALLIGGEFHFLRNERFGSTTLRQ